MEFVQIEWCKRKLIYVGYIYVKQKELANSVISYECEKCWYSSFKVKVKAGGNEVVSHENNLTHAADILHPEVLFVQQEIRRKLLTPKRLHSKSLPKQVQSEGLQGKYQNDANFTQQICMIPALAFIPPDKEIDAYETLQETMPPEADPIIDYFKDT
ncbi:hypothetical protein SK128_024439 [Halocaridina rubra]|uniref:Uncharacterized protein n=1 Tax=Halocaridina rubra TaxID=373956 RepID=A0AAN8WT23_HALRR